MEDPITIERIQLLHPKVRDEALKAYRHVNNDLLGKGVRLRFAHTLRTFDEQAALYALGRTVGNPQGKTARRPKGNIVTNANAGQSIHNYGLAFDIVLLYDADSNNTFETASWDIKADFDKDKAADWMEVANYFKSVGWKWGGDWKSFPDHPHFEKTGGHTWKTLLARHNAKDFFSEAANGKTYYWINI